MPPLPQYNRQTRLNGSPLSYEHYNINADTSGANIARAGANVAQGINQLTNSALQINEMQEEAKLVKGYNAISQWEEQNLHDKENGYYYKTGIDAAGKSQDVIKSFDDFIEQYKAQNKLSVPNQQRLDQIIQYSRRRIVQGVNAQDFKQTGVWVQTEGKLGIDNAISHAVNERNNPENIKVQLANIRRLTEWQGNTQGLDKPTIDLMTKNNISDAHCSIIQSLIAEGNLSAKDYFEKNKDEISADKQAVLLRAVTDLSENYTARDNANYMANLETQEAYKFLDGIKNPDLQDKTEREYNQILRRRREIEFENDKRISAEIMEEVYSMYDNGGGNISDIMAKVNRSDLSFETKERIYKNLKNMQELEQAGNNWADYNYLLDMVG
ncbi:MAG: hypothetical protein NC191_09745, partial [Muribaculaceae bacterium]|nr:hypothetical protein [Muribaculaceae bacterium]